VNPDNNFETDRKLMVQNQLRRRGIKNEHVLRVMEEMPRHLFVEQSIIHRAYDDCALPIKEGQTISQPYMVALMTEMLELTGQERVLEIGTGSGYQAAILSLLAAEVFTVERIPALVSEAQKKFNMLGLNNIHVSLGNGSIGFKEESPYDAIIVTASSPSIPESLIDQLGEGGRLVIPVGDRYSQLLYKVAKTEKGTITTTSTPCVFVPLIGLKGWQEI
jgi:protein-L-isoaspartate(D-aspartate) O-methyltransferase